jgi:hypothetical protein
MRKFFPVLATIFLAGCASHAFDGIANRSHGSWLDHVGKRPNPPLEMSNDEAAVLSAETLRLRGQADTIRVRLAAEADRRQRFRYYEQLRRIGDDLRPLEAQLRDAGRLA